MNFSMLLNQIVAVMLMRIFVLLSFFSLHIPFSIEFYYSQTNRQKDLQTWHSEEQLIK